MKMRNVSVPPTSLVSIESRAAGIDERKNINRSRTKQITIFFINEMLQLAKKARRRNAH